MSDFLPYGRHQIDEDDIAAVAEVLRSGQLTGGPKAGELEGAFAAEVGSREAVVCSNGTTALHLAVLTAGLSAGDQAIVPAVTFLATANVVRMCGADVIFADVDPGTGLMTPDTMLAAIAKADSDRLKVVLTVHLNGQAEHAADIYKMAKAAGLMVISDCAHALGAAYLDGGKPGDGVYEDFATFSLHPVKSVAMGEGGIVTLNDRKQAEQIRALRSHDMQRNPDVWKNEDLGWDASGRPNPWYYEMHTLGYNYRATDFQCALGLGQLGKLSTFIERRREIAALYDQQLAGKNVPLVPVSRSTDCHSAWHLYPVLIDFQALGIERGELMRRLANKGVGSQVHYVPVSEQPYYRALYGLQHLPGTDAYYSRVLSLPIFPAMSDDDVLKVVEALNDSF